MFFIPCYQKLDICNLFTLKAILKADRMCWESKVQMDTRQWQQCLWVLPSLHLLWGRDVNVHSRYFPCQKNVKNKVGEVGAFSLTLTHKQLICYFRNSSMKGCDEWNVTYVFCHKQSSLLKSISAQQMSQTSF